MLMTLKSKSFIKEILSCLTSVALVWLIMDKLSLSGLSVVAVSSVSSSVVDVSSVMISLALGLLLVSFLSSVELLLSASNFSRWVVFCLSSNRLVWGIWLEVWLKSIGVVLLLWCRLSGEVFEST